MKRKCLLNTYHGLAQRSERKNGLNIKTPSLFKSKLAKEKFSDRTTELHGRQSDVQHIQITKTELNPRFNDFGIEMVPEALRQRLFPQGPPHIDSKISAQCQSELKKFGLNKNNASFQDTYDIELPTSFKNLKDFFETAAQSQLTPYLEFIGNLTAKKLPSLPSEWCRDPGWTKYTSDGSVKVTYPCCSGIVFDVEVCIVDGNNLPSLAVAISPDYIYSWVSPGLDASWLFKRTPSTGMLIPLGDEKKIVVGHHVMYDRARVKEEYREERSNLRFLDTQSLHVCVSGLENSQKGQWLSANQTQKFDKKWMEVGSPNSLAAVHKLYCGRDLDKEARDVFVSGTHQDVQEEFQKLMTYCANDVIATHNVLTQVLPLFESRFPSKVTLAGMFEMAGCYIPLNDNWDKYVRQSDNMFFNRQGEIRQVLKGLADDVLLKYNLDKEKTLDDSWLKQLKWESKNSVGINNKKISVKARAEEEERIESERNKTWQIKDVIKVVCEDTVDKPKHYTSAPEWYRQHCPKATTYYDTKFHRGPLDISLSNQISPLLLKISFESNPVYHTHHYGWGYLKTKDEDQARRDQLLLQRYFPDVDILDPVDNVKNDKVHPVEKAPSERLEHLEKQIVYISKREEKQCVYVQKDFFRIAVNSTHTGNVGNPLGKLFTGAIENGTIASLGSYECQQVLKTGTGLTFWRNTRNRILSQFVVKLTDGDVARSSSTQLSVLLPQAVPAGTLTRRATEPLWLTAANVRKDRVGSEFKGIVSSFPGYCFVGADVDSQELWIASLIGDSTYGDHGATPLGWMSLQGQKSEGTDMHSKTAEQLSQNRPGLVSRDVAKAFNYARIYGAGKGLACSMLKDNADGLSDDEVSKIIDGMFDRTKGVVVYPLTALGRRHAVIHGLSVDAISITEKNLKVLSTVTGYPQYRLCNRRKPYYHGGTESAMFNNLEAIAKSPQPETPCLKSRITRSLEPEVVKDQQLRSRINWVVQSSAVDFLHLLLVSMKWLMSVHGIPGRFAISIHDEVRFHVPEEYKYEAALALQISNLLTRSLFAVQLGINDLPNSVAFFSGIEIDTSLRKNVHDDCVTPSNPLGLSVSYNIGKGQELDIKQLLQKINRLSK